MIQLNDLNLDKIPKKKKFEREQKKKSTFDLMREKQKEKSNDFHFIQCKTKLNKRELPLISPKETNRKRRGVHTSK